MTPVLLRYSLFALASVGLAVLSGLATFFNPVTLLLMQAAAPAVRLLGRQPPVNGFSSMGSALAVSLIWPLTLSPLHWLSYRVLGWSSWGYAGLLLGTGLVIAFVVLFINASPAT